ncbi:acyltransferase [Pedobacter sp. MC2016-15]|uniref:acyltransferase family protein n=1 Tax=Pedobacter sp. MC2016-15 TaxID=2994473 RepID=UPI0022462A8D|nr:acyltransferase [Pedobacter sp. MC2016-15]MCX2481154.1 acyltransferase [Pedobacter sp. MC2016-15]
MDIKKNSAPNQRNANADILKSLSIFAVVFIHGSHLLPFSASAIDFSKTQVEFIQNLFRFCVPVFIYLWAYFSEKSFIKRGDGNAFKRLYQLFIPFFVWSVVYLLLTADFSTLTVKSLITKHWVGYGWSGQYYFIILFQLIILFNIIRKITPVLSKFTSVIILLSIGFYALISYTSWFEHGVMEKLSYRPFVYWLPYMIVGILHAHKNIINISLPPVLIWLSPLLILAEILYLKPGLENVYMLPSVFICTLLLTSAVNSGPTYAELPAAFGRLVQSMANQTLGIFCLNPLVILCLSPLIMQSGVVFHFPLASVVCPLISTIGICAVCVLLIGLLKKLRLGFLVSN